jgi:hypothetical protein
MKMNHAKGAIRNQLEAMNSGLTLTFGPCRGQSRGDGRWQGTITCNHGQSCPFTLYLTGKIGTNSLTYLAKKSKDHNHLAFDGDGNKDDDSNSQNRNLDASVIVTSEGNLREYDNASDDEENCGDPDDSFEAKRRRK